MVDDKYIRQIFALVFIAFVLVAVFLIIQPIFFAIVFGFLLAYVFSPVHKKLLKKIKNETVSAGIICVTSLSFLTLTVWFIIPTLVVQLFEAFIKVQTIDVIGFLEKTFPFLFSSQLISNNFQSAYSSFISSTASETLNKFTTFLVDLPILALKLLVTLIAFFYGLRDSDKVLDLLREALPFKRNITNRFINKSKQVTFAVVYGRIIVGILTGLLTGIGFYILKLDNALLLTSLSILTSIIPIIGPWIVWIPVVVSLFLTERLAAGFFLLIYGGFIINLFEHILHPMLISKTSKIPTSLMLIGLIGGILVFGIFGIILGPLIMAYLAVLFEIYIEKNVLGMD